MFIPRDNCRSWWQVDLGSSDFELDRIVVTTRTSCLSRLFPSYVMVSQTPFARTGADIASLEAARQQAIFEYRLTTQQRTTTITLPRSMFGRYVRVQLGTKNCLHLCQAPACTYFIHTPWGTCMGILTCQAVVPCSQNRCMQIGRMTTNLTQAHTRIGTRTHIGTHTHA